MTEPSPTEQPDRSPPTGAVVALPVLLRVDEWYPELIGRPFVSIRTEPHIWSRIRHSDDIDQLELDVSDLLPASGLRARRAAVHELRSRLTSMDLPEGAVCVLDTSEGWLTTNISMLLRSRRPDIVQIGLQHGVFGLSSWRCRPIARRTRAAVLATVWAVAGFAPLGAGFGNLGLDGYVLFGSRFADYVRVLQPTVPLLVDFATLTGMTEPGNEQHGPDLLFLGQELATYLPDANRLVEQVIERLELLATEGHDVAARPHPKGDRAPWRAVQSVRLIQDSRPFTTVLGRNTVVVSFFSTGLLEAAHKGCRIVAIAHPDIGSAVYDAFDDPIPLDRFLGEWDFDEFTTLRPGTIS